MKLFNTKSSIEDIDEKGIVKIRVSAFGNIDSYGDIMDEKAFNLPSSFWRGDLLGLQTPN